MANKEQSCKNQSARMAVQQPTVKLGIGPEVLSFFLQIENKGEWAELFIEVNRLKVSIKFEV